MHTRRFFSVCNGTLNISLVEGGVLFEALAAPPTISVGRTLDEHPRKMNRMPETNALTLEWIAAIR